MRLLYPEADMDIVCTRSKGRAVEISVIGRRVSRHQSLRVLVRSEQRSENVMAGTGVDWELDQALWDVLSQTFAAVKDALDGTVAKLEWPSD